MVSNATPEPVVLGAVRKQAEKDKRSQSIIIISLWSLLLFLPPDSCSESLGDGLKAII